MKLQFKKQQFQEDAVASLVGIFEGQPRSNGVDYVMDSGKIASLFTEEGIKNAPIALNEKDILTNIRQIQRENKLREDSKIEKIELIERNDNGNKILGKRNVPTFTVEMETGTGKTYTFIKAIFEMNRAYGWTKFIIIVPSTAIREGTKKNLEITADHFAADYGKRADFFVYDSNRLSDVRNFASSSGINVMIINQQAFNSKKADDRRISKELDDFNGRRPIDVIAATNPIIIIDEPQSVLGNSKGDSEKATITSLARFNPLFLMNFSATHRQNFNMVYRLDPVDAYDYGLVKKIEVKGIELRGSRGDSGLVYLEQIIIPGGNKSPRVRLLFEKINKKGDIERISKILDRGDDLYLHSGEMEAYRHGFVISEIYGDDRQEVKFTGGLTLKIGEGEGDTTIEQIREIQIRHTIDSHLKKEAELFKRGIKALSLFFIDNVSKYRDYEKPDSRGIYAEIFEREYRRIATHFLEETLDLDPEYKEYLRRDIDDLSKIHAGYFSIDKKGKMVDPTLDKKTGESKNADDYNLIMKDKERLLSFDEPVRFLFSHTALSEGWDNPNIFQIATLRDTKSEVRRRQEIGRGLRLSVNKNGERQDVELLGKDQSQQVNVLTVVTDTSYEVFSQEVKKEYLEAIKNRPKSIDPSFFVGQRLVFVDENNQRFTHEPNTDESAMIFTGLRLSGVIMDDKTISSDFRNKALEEKLATIQEVVRQTRIENLEKFAPAILSNIERVVDTNFEFTQNSDKRETLRLRKDKFASPEFNELWSKINQKSYYTVNFEDSEIVKSAVDAINNRLVISALHATIKTGEMRVNRNNAAIGFIDKNAKTEEFDHSNSLATYDLVGEIADKTELLRKTVVEILQKISPEKFSGFSKNPEQFIKRVSDLINESKSSIVISHLSYNKLDEFWSKEEIFCGPALSGISGKNLLSKTEKHLYDKLIYDSNTEKTLAEQMDIHDKINLYVKLPGGFFIPTPFGKYNPDWAIVINDDNPGRKHIYFIAESKGSVEELQLREIEKGKINAARQHFKAISGEDIKYDIITNLEQLLEILKK